MKARVNLTIEEDVLANAKQYASRIGRSVSDLVENYLKNLAQNKKTDTLIDYIDCLKVPKVDENIDFKKNFYEDNADKYGF